MNTERLTKIVDGIATAIKEIVSEILNVKEDKRDEEGNSKQHRTETEHD